MREQLIQADDPAGAHRVEHGVHAVAQRNLFEFDALGLRGLRARDDVVQGVEQIAEREIVGRVFARAGRRFLRGAREHVAVEQVAAEQAIRRLLESLVFQQLPGQIFARVLARVFLFRCLLGRQQQPRFEVE